MKDEKKTIKVALTDRAPLVLRVERWLLIASAKWFDGEHECQANRTAVVRVRAHEDGRTIVYGSASSAWRGERGRESGYLVRGAGAVVAAIHIVADALGHPELAQECISDLPAEDADRADVLDETAPLNL